MSQKQNTKDAKKRSALMTPRFTVAFPHVWTPQAMDGGKPKYSVCAIWTPDKFTEAEKKLWAAMLEAVDKECRAKFGKPLATLEKLSNFKRGLRDGAEKEDLEGFGPGTTFANLTSMQRPGVVDHERETVDAGDPRVYAGAYARATVVVYGYDNKSKGYAFGLNNLQIVGAGSRIDGRAVAEDEFDETEYADELD